MTERQAPRNCPVCGDILSLTRLSCDDCGTELAGHFPTCEYCVLTSADRETLRVFLSSRGNMKEVERHLRVSYPTARARFDEILSKLGIAAGPPEEGAEEEPAQSEENQAEILEKLARGDIDVDAALRQMG